MTRAALHLEIDRPRDRQLWSRLEVIAGWIDPPAGDGFRMRAVCGQRELRVLPCPHPRALEDRRLRGFWTFLPLQDHLDTVRDGALPVEFCWADEPIRTVRFRLWPPAIELARSYPLDLEQYPVGRLTPRPGGMEAAARQEESVAGRTSLVFPGLGAVGGSSLNALMRWQMFQTGGATAVYDEASVPSLWRRLHARGRAAGMHWIDGHGCYDLVTDLPRPAARVTLLREPIRRMASVFNYGTLMHPADFPWETFEDFVASQQPRMLSQAAGILRLSGVSPTGLSDDDQFHLARAELRQAYALVGVAELFEETLFLVATLAGLRTIALWWPVLAAPRSFDYERLPVRVRRELDRQLSVDRLLYHEARRALRERVAAGGYGATLERYRRAAAAISTLPAPLQAIECLRWRQILADDARALTAAALSAA